jgi:LEA14-like dessication related protein
MNKGVIFGILAAASAAFYFLRGKKDLVNQLEVNIIDLNFDRKKSAEQLFLMLFFNVRLKLNNPTSGTLLIKQIYIVLYVDGKKAGTINKTDDFSIKANSNTIVNFTAQVLTANLADSLLRVIQTGENFQLRAQGYIETSFGRIPFEKNF